MGRVFFGPFDITAASQDLWANVGGRARTIDCNVGNRNFFFSTSRASHKMPRSSRLAHKAPVTQANEILRRELKINLVPRAFPLKKWAPPIFYGEERKIKI